MSSQIDPSVIEDNQKVDKADLRTQFGIARDEITELQKQVSIARRMFYEDTLWDSI